MPRDPRFRRTNINPEKDSCDTCQYNFGDICAGYGDRADNEEPTFGMPIEQARAMFPHGCDDYSISSAAYNEENG